MKISDAAAAATAMPSLREAAAGGAGGDVRESPRAGVVVAARLWRRGERGRGHGRRAGFAQDVDDKAGRAAARGALRESLFPPLNRPP